MKQQFKLVAAVLATVFSTSVFAGSFESWSMMDKRGVTTVVVSFAGDGKTQDAGVDLEIPAGYKVIKASAKVAGSVCTSNERIMRVVPPSGAGKALPSNAVDYCAFSLASTGGKAPVGKLALKQVFKECASPEGMHDCGHQDVSVAD